MFICLSFFQIILACSYNEVEKRETGYFNMHFIGKEISSSTIPKRFSGENRVVVLTQPAAFSSYKVQEQLREHLFTVAIR